MSRSFKKAAQTPPLMLRIARAKHNEQHKLRTVAVCFRSGKSL